MLFALQTLSVLLPLKGRGNIKLTKKEVKEIRLAKGTQREICKQYGISQHHVSDIKNRLSWAWL